MSQQPPGPIRLGLEAGTYYWCKCGKSERQPFCDGSHKGTGVFPVRFDLADNRPRAYCVCKKSATPPFCDGSHAQPEARELP